MDHLQQLSANDIKNLSLSIYTNEEIEQISVKRIISDKGISSLRHVIKNGLYDLSMGTLSTLKAETCQTCHQKYPYCSGHCGHIQLCFSVINPLFLDDVKKLMNFICIKCYSYAASSDDILSFHYQNVLIRSGYALSALDVPVLCNSKSLENYDAEEVNVAANGEEVVTDQNLKHKLAKFIKNIKRKVDQITVPTVHSHAIEHEIIKKFQVPPPKACKLCSTRLLRVCYVDSQLFISNIKEYDEAEDDCDDGGLNLRNGKRIITPEEAKTILRKCWIFNSNALSSLYPFLIEKKTEHPTDLFFITNLLVIPNQLRPFEILGELVRESEINAAYTEIIRISRSLWLLALYRDANEEERKEIPKDQVTLMSLFPGDTWQERVHKSWGGLQIAINSIYDTTLTKSKLVRGIRQRLEKKEGLLRGNLMGKRVDYSARSLAAPDPYLNVDEIGVPREFARILTLPVTVTQWNASYLRKLITNGNSQYPGANFLRLENGKKIDLTCLNKAKRIAYAKSLITPDSDGSNIIGRKIVYRHLINGDYVLMNRQPTLHKPSIQAHKARVTLYDRVLRMPYANCKAYNADFDGDEINLYFPQGIMAEAELKKIVSTHENYLSPKDGSPLAGLIQDCVVAGVKMTVRGQFFTKKEYQQLVGNSLWDHKSKIRLMHPAILKPQQLWTGKQIISTIMLNLLPPNVHKPTFSFKTSVKCDIWQTQDEVEWKAGGTKEKYKESMTESEWVMRCGELLCGVVDKCAIGSTSYSLIHVCYDLYGGKIASKLMSAINRLCLCVMPLLGHTIGLIDFVSPKEVNRKRRRDTNVMINDALDLVAQKVDTKKENLQSYIRECHHLESKHKIKMLESAYKTSFDPGHIARENEKGLYRCSLDNNMKMMVDTGAKGSKINLNQMASLFGELTIDGKRIKVTAGGKTLPAFEPYDPNPLAGGYIKDRYISGMDSKSVFFLSMAGRDSLQHTAVKTANSGYMQRCLMKHLEGITVNSDCTVRNSDGLVLQFKYGEDGQDACKMPFLNNYHGFDVVADNYSKIMTEKEKYQDLKNKCISKYKKKTSKLRHSEKAKILTGFRAFYEALKNVVKKSDDIDPSCGRSLKFSYIQTKWFSLTDDEKREWGTEIVIPDPVAAVYNSCRNLGSVSESFDDVIDKYYEEKYSKRSKYNRNLSKRDLKESLYMKVLNAEVEPGHAVGALCAQSIGEPLTQMTLNTFHLVGQDDLNITLGVPRMIEILKGASETISTPYMEVPFLPEVSQEQAQRIKCNLTPIRFQDIVASLTVSKECIPASAICQQAHFEITIIIKLWDKKYCKNVYNVDPMTIKQFAESTFVTRLDNDIGAACKNVNMGDGRIYLKKNIIESEEDDIKNDEIKDEEIKTEEITNEDSESEDEQQEDSDRRITPKIEEYSDEEDVPEDQDEKNVDILDDNAEKKKIVVAVASKTSINRSNIYNKKTNSLHYTLQLSVSYYVNINMTSLVKNSIADAHVRSVRNINQTVVSEKNNTLFLKTDGVNFNEIIKYRKYLDVNRFYTNNIVTMANMYGIEAAQRAIIKEIRTVQKAYNITVDYRHLSLLADYFTSEGIYKACSRHALSTCASSIQSFTFETAFHVMKKTLIRGKKDNLNSPSANVLLGKPMKQGTNSVKISLPCAGESYEHNARIYSHMH